MVDGLANELVAKCVAGEPARFEHMVRHRLVQGLEPLGFLQRRHDGEEAVRDEAASDGDDAQQLLGAGRQPLRAHEEDVAQRGREIVRRARARGDELLGEERVALGALEHRVHEPGIDAIPEDARELLAHLVARERLEVDPLHAAVALELDQQRAQGMAAIELVRPVGRDQLHALPAQIAGQEREQVASRAIGPVHVLEHEHQRIAHSRGRSGG